MRRSVACDKPALGGGIQRLKIRLLFVGQLFFLAFFLCLSLFRSSLFHSSLFLSSLSFFLPFEES